MTLSEGLRQHAEELASPAGTDASALIYHLREAAGRLETLEAALEKILGICTTVAEIEVVVRTALG